MRGSVVASIGRSNGNPKSKKKYTTGLSSRSASVRRSPGATLAKVGARYSRP
jgi:hypothetical protein